MAEITEESFTAEINRYIYTDIDVSRVANVASFATKKFGLEYQGPKGDYFFVVSKAATILGSESVSLRRRGLTNTFLPGGDHEGRALVPVIPGQTHFKDESGARIAELQARIEDGQAGNHNMQVDKHLSLGRGSERQAAKLSIQKLTILSPEGQNGAVTTLHLQRSVRDMGCIATQILYIANDLDGEVVAGSHLEFRMKHEGEMRPVQNDDPWASGRQVDELYSSDIPLGEPLSDKQWVNLMQKPLQSSLLLRSR